MREIKIGIIGAGPAGISAAIQLKKFGYSPVLFEKASPGGLLWNASHVNNYLGFPSGISGSELCGLMESQINEFGVEIMRQEVKELDYDGKNFTVSISGETKIFNFMIIAAGTKPKKPEEPNLSDEIMDFVYYEVRDLLGLNNTDIYIIGGGDIAFDYAVSLSVGNKVKILNRSSRIKANDSLYNQVLQNNQIEYIDQITLCNVTLNSSGLKLNLIKSGEEESVHCDRLIFAIGRVPAKDFYSTKLVELERDLINNNKLFLIGDIVNGNYRQAAIAAGDGVKAAMKLNQIIHEEE